MISPIDLMSPHRALPWQDKSRVERSSFLSTLPVVVTIDAADWNEQLVQACADLWDNRVQWAQPECVRSRPHGVCQYVLYVNQEGLNSQEIQDRTLVLSFGKSQLRIDLQEAIEEYPFQCCFALERKLQEQMSFPSLRKECMDGILSVYTKTYGMYAQMKDLGSQRTELASPTDLRDVAEKIDLSISTLLGALSECNKKIARMLPDPVKQGTDYYQSLRERVEFASSLHKIREGCINKVIKVYERVYRSYEVFRITVTHQEAGIPSVENLRLLLQKEPSLDKGLALVEELRIKMQGEVDAWKATLQ